MFREQRAKLDDVVLLKCDQLPTHKSMNSVHTRKCECQNAKISISGQGSRTMAAGGRHPPDCKCWCFFATQSNDIFQNVIFKTASLREHNITVSTGSRPHGGETAFLKRSNSNFKRGLLYQLPGIECDWTPLMLSNVECWIWWFFSKTYYSVLKFVIVFAFMSSTDSLWFGSARWESFWTCSQAGKVMRFLLTPLSWCDGLTPRTLPNIWRVKDNDADHSQSQFQRCLFWMGWKPWDEGAQFRAIKTKHVWSHLSLGLGSTHHLFIYIEIRWLKQLKTCWHFDDAHCRMRLKIPVSFHRT